MGDPKLVMDLESTAGAQPEYLPHTQSESRQARSTSRVSGVFLFQNMHITIEPRASPAESGLIGVRGQYDNPDEGEQVAFVLYVRLI